VGHSGTGFGVGPGGPHLLLGYTNPLLGDPSYILVPKILVPKILDY